MVNKAKYQQICYTKYTLFFPQILKATAWELDLTKISCEGGKTKHK
jgi:hypothetical protein